MAFHIENICELLKILMIKWINILYCFLLILGINGINMCLFSDYYLSDNYHNLLKFGYMKFMKFDWIELDNKIKGVVSDHLLPIISHFCLFIFLGRLICRLK